MIGVFTRLALQLYPRHIRERHGTALADLYRDMYLGRGWRGRFTYVVRLLSDAIPQGLAARFESLGKSGKSRRNGRGPTGERDPGPRPGRGEAIATDVRYAFRHFRRNPAFTAVALSTLAIGIGANVAVFSLVDAVLLTSLPYPDSEGVVELVYQTRNGSAAGASVPDVEDARAGVGSLAFLSEVQFTSGTLLLDAPTRVQLRNVGPGFFDVFRVAPALGRWPLPDEYAPGAPPVAVLSHEGWTDHFDADVGILGSTVSIDGWDGASDTALLQPVIIGIMPEGFVDPFGPDPAMWLTQPTRHGRGTRIFQAVGRVASDGSLDEARAELAAVAAALQEAHPDTNAELSMGLVPAHQLQVADARRPLLTLSAAVGLLLLVACVNAANLMMSRARRRAPELAIRMSLGASRRRVAGQLITESLVMGLLSGILGIALAWASLDVLVGLTAESLPDGRSIAMDVRVLGFGLGISVLTGLLFGTAPALRAAPRNTRSRGGSEGPSGRSARVGLVMFEIAVSVVLLSGAGLLVRSFVNVVSRPAGFDGEGVVVFQVAPSVLRHPERDDITRLYQQITERVAAVPGVTAVGSSSFVPVIGGFWNSGFVFDDTPEAKPSAHVRAVTAGYFDAMGVPVVRGRGFNGADREGGVEVAVVNEAFVARYLPDRDPIGVRLTMNRPSRVIVGVVGDTRFLGLGSEAEPELYTPHPQQREWWLRRTQWIVVRAPDASALMPAIRSAVREIDPSLPINRVSQMDEVVMTSAAGSRVMGTLVGTFALIALALTGVGVGGVMAFNVASRTREFGIRVALGSEPTGLVARLLRESLVVVAVGCGIGLVGSLAAGTLISSLLFGIEARDPVTLMSVVGLVAAVTLIATYLPARSIARLDPVRALRGD